MNGYLYKQESLANAKVSARQPWHIGRNSLNRPHLGSIRNINVIYTSWKVLSMRNNFFAGNASLSSFV